MAKRIDELLVSTETCQRQSFWHLDWEPAYLTSKEFLEQGVKRGLTTPRQDFGVAAGEFVMGLAAEKEVRLGSGNQFDGLVNIANLSDIIATAIRKPLEGPWKLAKPIDMRNGYTWDSGALLDPSGTFLRRLSFVSDWSDDRHYATCRHWSNLGTVCAYGCDLQLVVVVVGSFREGRYRSPWTQGLRHPKNRGVRFKKKNQIESGFKDSWFKVWREDSGDISTKTWLEMMTSDGVLQSLLIRVDIPCPEPDARQQILDLAKRKLDRLKETTELPEQNLTTCHWPIPCCFRKACHNNEQPSGSYGFVKIER